MTFRTILPALAALLLLAAPAAAQDVEMLGRVYGTRPPASYDELRARDPGAFEFQRAWRGRTGLGLSRLPGGEPGGAPGPLRSEASSGSATGTAPAAALGGREGPVQGVFRVPLVLGLFSDSPAAPPFTRERVAAQFFDGPNPTGTITDYYREISGGRVELLGHTFPWSRASLTGAQVAGGVSGLGGSSRVGQYIVELLAPLKGAVDWGRFDNDGPDGVPNSGDDDGFVDVLAVMHPEWGAECDQSATRVWSHRWTLAGAVGQIVHTASPAAGGGTIRINDYTIQPVRECPQDGEDINAIGVFAHELGHGFGLPDLYATGDERHAGIGRWGLMGTGSWGCGTFDPSRPCHMSAWSKAALGWVEVETLPSGADLGTLVLDPVETSGRVLRVDAGDGSGEYFLLENRQRIGFDGSLPSPGLLVWHVDASRVAQRWSLNAVNSESRHMGVWLRQADGRDDLARPRGTGNSGDAGDPFPGSTGASAFHAGSAPASFSHRGTATGLTLLDVATIGPQVRFRALTRYQTLSLAGVGTLSAFQVDGEALPAGDRDVPTAPFQTRRVVAPGGAEVREGVRRAFTGWSDLPGGERERTWVAGLEDATLTARFEGGEEVRLRMDLEGDTLGIAPGAVEVNPASADGWYVPGTELAVLAEARPGFAFLGWEGGLAGEPNPVLVTLTEPLDATAVFEQAFGVEGSAAVALEAAAPTDLVLQARDGSPPYAWTLAGGRLPEGLTMTASGRIAGAAVEKGTFALVVQAVDALGLVARAQLALEVEAPSLGVARLTDPFFLRPSTLTAAQQTYLDREGNGNGAYDLGDFRAYVLDNPDLPMTAAQRAQVEVLVPLVDFRRGGGG